MSKDLLYSILDLKSAVFDAPFTAISDADAQRGIIIGLRSGKPLFARFPEDYSLYFVGHLDKTTGALVSTGTPRHIVNIQSLALAETSSKEMKNAPSA